MLAPPPRPPRPPGCPRPRSAFTDEEWNKLAQLLYKGARADEVRYSLSDSGGQYSQSDSDFLTWRRRGTSAPSTKTYPAAPWMRLSSGRCFPKGPFRNAWAGAQYVGRGRRLKGRGASRRGRHHPRSARPAAAQRNRHVETIPTSALGKNKGLGAQKKKLNMG